MDYLIFECGTDTLLRNGGNYQPTPCNILEERRPQECFTFTPLRALMFMRRVLFLNIFVSYSRTPFSRINWDNEPSGYVENPDNWIFL